MDNHRNNLIKDAGVIFLSVIVAIILVKTQAIENLLTATGGLTIVGSFIAGLFFVSIFTAVPATVALAEIARAANSVLLVALIGGLGAMLGDLVIFRFIKNNLAEDLFYLIKKSRSKRFFLIFHLRLFRRLTILLGALIIASPLPDEIGLAMMGLSKLKTYIFIPLSFILNSSGILVIGLIAQHLN
ncbi:MAG: Uncharacterized protein Athens071426_288 [Parcubacteria group bacterium Athens0714_26]|nr:MAG: Uncharacterized protein Athens101426_468 [Parcubacteria group bacterium Athens1014_26]TSD03129.1 MAG: Uncharacterized protein Athens071426_288 [Parcubacteria group bacterium Athens0714_26]